MKRRAYLAAVSAAASSVALAGCTGSPAGNGNTTDENTTTDQPTSDGTTTQGAFPYAIDAVRTDDAPVENATMDVTVTQEFTYDHPARIEVSFTNDADEARTFQFGSLVPWDGLRGQHQSSAASLLLDPGDNVIPDAPTDDCWQATSGIGLPEVMREETLDPGETVSHAYAVLAAHDSQDCHPPGTYRFAQQNYLEAGWGFELDVVPLVEN